MRRIGRSRKRESGGKVAAMEGGGRSRVSRTAEHGRRRGTASAGLEGGPGQRAVYGMEEKAVVDTVTAGKPSGGVASDIGGGCGSGSAEGSEGSGDDQDVRRNCAVGFAGAVINIVRNPSNTNKPILQRVAYGNPRRAYNLKMDFKGTDIRAIMGVELESRTKEMKLCPRIKGIKSRRLLHESLLLYPEVSKKRLHQLELNAMHLQLADRDVATSLLSDVHPTGIEKIVYDAAAEFSVEAQEEKDRSDYEYLSRLLRVSLKVSVAARSAATALTLQPAEPTRATDSNSKVRRNMGFNPSLLETPLDVLPPGKFFGASVFLHRRPIRSCAVPVKYQVVSMMLI
ncbi:hypothetical protein K438DRAFT_1755519 [Mycena galopus ATCC 62051]|nr:hypothetical protein K438DRAFT_1755519 [Mycena galopus ATCC 62051]